MPLTLERQNAYRARYARQTPGWQPATVIYEAAIRAQAAPGQQLLDLGCGRGGVLEQIGDLGLWAVGVDPDVASLREHRLPRLPRAAADAAALPLANGVCDLVISAWVLEHLPAPACVLAEVGRVLKPGGVFIALTPNRHSPVAWLNRTLRPLQRTLVPRLYGRVEADTFPVVYRANTRAALTHLAQQAGMRLEALHTIHDPTYLAFNDALYQLNVGLTRLLPPALAVHLVVICRKTPA